MVYWAVWIAPNESGFLFLASRVNSPYTIVAGTGGPRGPWSPFGDEFNDGIVALSETRLSLEEPIVQLPVEHTFMMNDPTVQKWCCGLLNLKSKPKSSG